MDNEALILTGALNYPDTAKKLIHTLTEQHFRNEEFKKVFSSMKYLYEINKPIDFISVMELQKKFKFKADTLYGLNAYIIPDQSYVDEIFFDLMVKHIQQDYLFEHAKLMQNPNPSEFMHNLKHLYGKYFIPKIVMNKIHSYSDLFDKSDEDPSKSFVDIVKKRCKETSHKNRGIQLGILELDKVLGFIPFGTYCIIGARTSVGKTSTALSLGARIADLTSPVTFITLEMKASQIRNKVVSQSIDISSHQLDMGHLQEWEIQALERKIPSLRNDYMFVYETSSLYLESLDSFFQQAIEQTSSKVFFIDYLTLIKTQTRFQSKHLEINAISKELQALAKKHNICIFALAQLSRDIERRTNKTPTLADLRESGSLEEDADFVMLLSRPYLDNPEIDPNIINIHVAKNRLHGYLKTLTFKNDKGNFRLIEELE